MDKREKKQVRDWREDSLSLLLTMIFEEAFPVWRRYKGNVSAEKLSELDLAGDWPSGTANRAMRRLNRDPQLRKQPEQHIERQSRARIRREAR
jgi:hypothetical protein